MVSGAREKKKKKKKQGSNSSEKGKKQKPEWRKLKLSVQPPRHHHSQGFNLELLTTYRPVRCL
jgi:hypothetical protein